VLHANCIEYSDISSEHLVGLRKSRNSYCLDHLLFPVARQEFYSRYWEREVLHVVRGDAAHFAALPGMDDVERLITATVPEEQHDRIVKVVEGKRIEEPLVYKLGVTPDLYRVLADYREGASIVLSHVHKRCPSIAKLTGGLRETLHHPVGANLYLTPANSQCFPPHFDTHDVFILQLAGSKIWRLGAVERELPLNEEMNHRPRNFAPARELTLAVGDVLYLPRGTPHEAVATDASSLHLTVGVHVLRLVDYLTQALQQMASDDIRLRRALRPGFLDAPIDGALAGIVADLGARLADSRLEEQTLVRLGGASRRNRAAAQRGHFRSIDAIAKLDDASQVTCVDGAFVRVEDRADGVAIVFGGNFVSGPARMADAFAFVAAHRSFVVGDLPGLRSREERRKVVDRLISEGLLLCLSDDGGEYDN